MMDEDENLPVPQRHADGRFMPGNRYAQGRARDRLSKAFLADLFADWDAHGRETIARVRAEAASS